MWEKIKKAFSIVGATLSALFFGLMFFFIGRSSSNRRRSTDNSYRTGSREEGTRDNTTTVTEVQGRVETATRKIGTAEDILRGAIKRSREEKQETTEHNDNN